eukprot:1355981-Pyramimonas_sp.AAC.1
MESLEDVEVAEMGDEALMAAELAEEGEPLQETPSRRRYLKFVAAFVLLVLLVLTLVLTDTKKHYIDFMEWVDEHKVEGALAFIGLFSISEGGLGCAKRRVVTLNVPKAQKDKCCRRQEMLVAFFDLSSSSRELNPEMITASSHSVWGYVYCSLLHPRINSRAGSRSGIRAIHWCDRSLDWGRPWPVTGVRNRPVRSTKPLCCPLDHPCHSLGVAASVIQIMSE